MILFYLILGALILAGLLNFKSDRTSAVLFILLGILWFAMLLIFGVPPQGVVD